MKLFQDLSLKKKLLLLNLSICGVVLLVALASMFVFQILNFRSNFKGDLATLAAVVADNSTAALAFKDVTEAAEVINSLRAKPTVVAATLVTPEGVTLARFGKAMDAKALSQYSPVRGFRFKDGKLFYTEAVELNGKNLGQLQLAADYQQPLQALVGFYVLIIVVVVIVSILLAIFLSGKLGRIITQPVLQLAHTALVVGAQKDYSMRAPSGGRGDELGRLTDAFNQMLDNIEAKDRALKESQERFEVAIAGVNDGIWDWDIKADKIFFSPQWKKILGYSDEEIENKFSSFVTLLHPDDAEKTVGFLNDYLESGRGTYQREFRMREKSGHYRWILARGAALRGDDQKPYRMAGSHTDIDDRKQAEEEVRMAREKFETLVNSVDGIVWEVDVATSQTLFISKQAESVLGYSPNRWVEDSEHWKNCLHPDDRDKTIEARKRGSAEGKPFQLECRAIAADGRTVWLRESISVLVEEGKPTRMRGLTIDITARKNADAELARLNSELMSSSRQAGMAEVATGVLHNVGNVLNSVSVSATLVSERLRASKVSNLQLAAGMLREKNGNVVEFLTKDPKGKLLPEYFSTVSNQIANEQRQLVTEMDLVAQHIEHIKEIVSMQQSYAKVSGAFENLPPALLVEDALRMNSAAFDRHRVKVIREFADDIPFVCVDRHKVLQILINVFRNAKYAMDGHISDKKQLVIRIALAFPNQVEIVVIDNGMGIAPENIVKIFGHGFTTKKDGHGFGLHSGALAAKEMGGSLSAQSAGLGLGAEFTLRLPVAAKKTAKAEPVLTGQF